MQHQVLICYFDKFNGFGIKTIERFICATKVINDLKACHAVQISVVKPLTTTINIWSYRMTRPCVCFNNNIPE